MTPPDACDLLTIGHSNLPADRFVTLLRNAGVTTVADVRSVPFSRRFPWFSGKALAERLMREGIAYMPLGEGLGGRPRPEALLRWRRRLRRHGEDPGISRRPRPRDRRHALHPPVPDVRGTRAARLPPLPAGEPRARRARSEALSYPRRRHDRAACGDRGSPAQARGRRRRGLVWRSRGPPCRGLSPARRQDGSAREAVNCAESIPRRWPRSRRPRTVTSGSAAALARGEVPGFPERVPLDGTHLAVYRASC